MHQEQGVLKLCVIVQGGDGWRTPRDQCYKLQTVQITTAAAAEEKVLLKNVMQYLRYRYARRLTYQTKQHFNV